MRAGGFDAETCLSPPTHSSLDMVCSATVFRKKLSLVWSVRRGRLTVKLRKTKSARGHAFRLGKHTAQPGSKA
jgi:hypothetical protein